MTSSPKHEFLTRPARRYIRRRLDMRIRIALAPDAVDVIHGRCVTISEGGFGAILSADLPDRDDVWVEFRSANIPPETRFHAEIRQRRGFQFGFQFIAPSPKDKVLLRQVLAEAEE